MSRLKHARAALLDAWYACVGNEQERERQLRAYRNAVIDDFISDVYEAVEVLEATCEQSQATHTLLGVRLMMNEVVRVQANWEERL